MRGMTAATVVALVSAVLATIIALIVPLVTFRLALRQDEMRWLRERRAELYVDLLTEAVAERERLEYALADEETQKRAAQFFKDVRLPPLDRARLGARAAMVGSRAANRLFNDLTREAGQALLNTAGLDPEALQIRTAYGSVG
jgi:hypothetical protein